MIPIAILHRNEFSALRAMLESIRSNTRYPHRVFVVDNSSSDPEARKNFEEIRREYPDLILLESNVNNWILGFNKVLSHPQWPSDGEYYVFSDADIVLPPVEEGGECWLARMVHEMDTHACIGKLGISLKISDIDNETLRADCLKRDLRYRSSPRIGKNYISPVDTTLAIYRNNFFIGSKFRFSIGHGNLARPYYYTCRTDRSLEARHLGWYESYRLHPNSLALREKIRCFAMFGACVLPENLVEAHWTDRFFYKIVHPISVFYWGVIVLFNIAIYIFSRFPKRINEIQNAVK